MMLESRKKYTSTEIEICSKRIMIKLFTYFNFDDVEIVHMFLPIEEKNEVDTFMIIDTLKINYPDIQIILPVINNNQLDHKYYYSNTKLSKNRYGILEPPVHQKNFTSLDMIDIILIPLLAFDTEGHRVGYGGGYYDKFLAKCNKSIKIGLSLDKPIDKIVDVNKYDIKLDYCITPNKVYHLNKCFL